MPTTYKRADEPERIGRELLFEHHEHLINAEIRYVFRDPPAKTKGKETWAKARKISGLNSWLTNETPSDAPVEPTDFFVIEIAELTWEALSDDAKKALIDHELSHCWYDPDEDTYALLPHDIEEFAAVVARHGLWRGDLKAFGRAAQMTIEEALEDA